MKELLFELLFESKLAMQFLAAFYAISFVLEVYMCWLSYWIQSSFTQP